MKKSVLALALVSINFTAVAEETSWIDSIKSLIGMDSNTTQKSEVKTETSQHNVNEILSTSGLIDMLTSSLNVSGNQAEGGMGALFNFAKNNLSGDNFTQLASSLPGVNNLINKMPTPAASESNSTDTISGMLDTASQYSDSIKSINEVKKQFEALGLDPAMIGQYITAAQNYLNTPAGAQAKELFTQGVSQLMGS